MQRVGLRNGLVLAATCRLMPPGIHHLSLDAPSALLLSPIGVTTPRKRVQEADVGTVRASEV